MASTDLLVKCHVTLWANHNFLHYLNLDYKGQTNQEVLIPFDYQEHLKTSLLLYDLKVY